MAETSDTSKIKVSFRMTGGTQFEEEIDTSITVKEVKDLCAERSSIPATSQRIIYRGRILKDEETLKHHNVQAGHSLHVIRSGGGAGVFSGPTPTPAPPAPAQAQPTGRAPMQTPGMGLDLGALSAAGGLGSMGADQLQNMEMLDPGNSAYNPQAASVMGLIENPAFRRMTTELMNNPQHMQAILSNPMVMQMMQNLQTSGGPTGQWPPPPPPGSAFAGFPMTGTPFPTSIPVAPPANPPINPTSATTPSNVSGATATNPTQPGTGVNSTGLPTNPLTATTIPPTTQTGPGIPGMTVPGADMPNGQQNMGAIMSQMQQMIQSDPNFHRMQQEVLNGIRSGQFGPPGTLPPMPSAVPGAAAIPPTPSPPDNRPPEERFSTQLASLREMGFVDTELSIQALTHCAGNVNNAIQFILERQM